MKVGIRGFNDWKWLIYKRKNIVCKRILKYSLGNEVHIKNMPRCYIIEGCNGVNMHKKRSMVVSDYAGEIYER